MSGICRLSGRSVQGIQPRLDVAKDPESHSEQCMGAATQPPTFLIFLARYVKISAEITP